MPDSSPQRSPAELFQHADFLKRLARGLLRDEHLAEDAAQDAFVRALERPPRSQLTLPAWLGRVARNVALNRLQGETRRRRRERESARAERVEADQKAVERMELQRAVAELVLRLDEAKRTALYLRYHEGLEPLAISKQLGVPVKTVKTRLARALEELRAALDARSRGDRSAWVSAFLPLAATSEGLAATSELVGSFLMKKTVVALALLLGAGFLWKSVRPPEAEVETAAVLVEEVLAEPRAPAEASFVPSLREELARSEPEARGTAEAAPEPGELEHVWIGRIVDGTDGAPLAGARVERVLGDPFHEHTGQPTAWSGTDGRVQLDFSDSRVGYARVEHDGYAAACVRLDAGHERPVDAFPVRLLRAATLELFVTDAGGRARADVEVRATHVVDEALQGGFNGRPHHLGDPSFVGRTDQRGRCELEGLPAQVALSLAASGAEGVLRSEERALRLEPGERRTLHWTVGGPCRIEGRTLEANGLPAAGVTVWLIAEGGTGMIQAHHEDGALTAISDARGRFELEVAAGSWSLGPAPLEWEQEEEAIAPVGTPLVILPGQDSAEVTLTCWRGLYLKGRVLAAGGDVPRSAYVTASGETFAGATARGGEFTLGPLPPGTFVVRASAPGVQGVAPSESLSVAAGAEDLELVLRHAAGLSVRVLAPDGNPVVDAMVWVLPEPGSEGGFGQRSNATGVAAFTGLGAGTYSLSASSAAGEFALMRGERLEAGDARELELRLVPAALLRLEILPRPEPRMSVEILQGGCPIAMAVGSEAPVVPLAPGEYELALKHFRDGRPVVLQRQHVRVLEGGETRALFDLSASR